MKKSNILRLAVVGGSCRAVDQSCSFYRQLQLGLMQGEPLHCCFCPWLVLSQTVPVGMVLCLPLLRGLAPEERAAPIFVLGRAARQNLWVQNTREHFIARR